MADYWIGIIIWVAILLVAIPYVRRIRHPAQKPVAAYLIFVSLFTMVAIVLFGLLAWLVGALNWGAALSRLIPALAFLALVLVPAWMLASWQARKPPLRRPPPS